MNARARCLRCRRPEVACWCAHLPELPTRTRVVVLQHPRERKMAIGTARMAHLALPNSVLRVGLRFDGDAALREELAAGPPAYVLFPDDDAVDVRALGPEPITLVVIDGTWTQARNLLRRNHALAALPRVAFSPARPSEYRIRRQPAAACVSTVEALAEVLQVLEPDAGPFERLLDPFRAMVDRQVWFKTEVRASRHQRGLERRRAITPRPTLGARLRADWEHLVCIEGDANAWPIGSPARRDPELVHVVAVRPATGARYEAVIAPRAPLSPSTPAHVELSAARLAGGMTVPEWLQSWQAFVEPDDVLVHWGGFHLRLARDEGLALPRRRRDLRAELAQALGRRAGSVEDGVAQVRAQAAPLGLDGRAGRRLASLAAIVRALCDEPPR